MHNLDTCEVTAVGDELDGEHESLELDMSQLQQRGLEMSSSNLGLVITGTDPSVVDERLTHALKSSFSHNTNAVISVEACIISNKPLFACPRGELHGQLRAAPAPYPL